MELGESYLGAFMNTQGPDDMMTLLNMARTFRKRSS